MKKQLVNVLRKIGFVSVMALVTTGGSAHGQALAYELRANIPFDFIAADKKLPAGEYYIGRAQQDSGDRVLSISSKDLSTKVFLLTNAVQVVEPKGKPTLVFHRYGGRYFFSQIWMAGSNTGRVLAKSRREKKIQQVVCGSRKAKLVEVVPVVVGLW